MKDRELVDVKGDLQLSKNPEFLPLLLQKLQILGGFQFMSDFPSQAPLPPHLDHRAEVVLWPAHIVIQPTGVSLIPHSTALIPTAFLPS